MFLESSRDASGGLEAFLEAFVSILGSFEIILGLKKRLPNNLTGSAPQRSTLQSASLDNIKLAKKIITI